MNQLQKEEIKTDKNFLKNMLLFTTRNLER